MISLLVGYLFWVSVAVSAVSIIYGLVKKSWRAFFLSGISFIPAALYAGVGGELRLVLLVPVILFALAYVLRKNRIAQ
ncbi:hypothetical protein [Neobacillus sp. D3-1R]|uniref:hypothetical protein n=1 Tax=Neobacillus sp. D3-1R TaxID=3445778 RepID=UPI003F9F3CDC